MFCIDTNLYLFLYQTYCIFSHYLISTVKFVKKKKTIITFFFKHYQILSLINISFYIDSQYKNTDLEPILSFYF